MLTKEQIKELSERSKDDKAIIVGSEVRQLCNLALASLAGEVVWCVVAPSGYRESYHSTKENADYMTTVCGPGWTVAPYRLVKMGA